MPDLRSRLKNRQPKAAMPIFKNYQINKDKRGGFSVSLNWDYDDSKIIGFRIYKAIFPKPLLQRNYLVSQRALEKLTPAKTPRSESQILYSKNFFVENSKVKFFQSDTGRHQAEETLPRNLNYSILHFCRTSPNKTYTFTDKDIQFGSSYSYVLTALTKDYKETPKGTGFIVNVEDLTPPMAVKNLVAREGAGGILVSFTMDHPEEVESYLVFRRKVEEKIFGKIFEGRITQKNGAILDETAQAGNEYQYKVYLRDYFGNVSWHSEIAQVEFKSRFLSKGAIIDPLIRITYDNPNIVIQGLKNSNKIIGYRIERKDLWRKEKDFEIKKNNEIYWPNTIFFNQKGLLELKDSTVYPDRVYKYRVSSISITGKTESIYVSPPIRPEKGLVVDSPGFKFQRCNPMNLVNFQANPLYTSQNPIYAKIQWNILGDWDYVKIIINEEKPNEKIIRVDNPHYHIFYNELEKGNKYTLKLKIYNKDNEFIESEIVTLNL